MAFKTFLLVLSISCVVGAATVSIKDQPITPGFNLKARLLYGESTSGGLGDCWSALLELKACTNEIVIFFLNGESYLGFDCCRAIRIITRDCWPSMLTSLGFTSQEGDILRDYCDALPTSVSPIQAPVKASIGVV